MEEVSPSTSSKKDRNVKDVPEDEESPPQKDQGSLNVFNPKS